MSKAKLKLILGESSLELAPRALWRHPAIKKSAERRGKKVSEVLLEVSLHRAAMQGLERRWKRGRPDIVHLSLLNALGSPLNIEGFLEVYVHTIGDLVIFVRHDVRLPRDYRRFVGLMEQLLVKGKVPPYSAKPLLYVKTMSLRRLVKSIGAENVILLSEKGVKVCIDEVAEEAFKPDSVVIVGGFPHGDFEEETYDIASKVYSIYNKSLDAWIVVSRIIEACERKLRIL